jgi:hypothetical protein
MVNAAECPYDPQGEFELHGIIPPGGSCEIKDGYCRAGRTLNGDRKPSIAERLAPFLVPADPDLRLKWGKEEVAPPPPAPTVNEVAAKLEAEGRPPGAASLIADGMTKRKPGRPPKARE